VTPLPVEAILEAQQRALREHFMGPLAVLGGLNLALWSALFLFWRPLEMDAAAFHGFSAMFGGGFVVLLVDLWALGWVGMWRGLNVRQVHKAVIVTLAQVLGPCWLLLFFFWFYALTGGAGSEWSVTFFIIIWLITGCLVDLVLVARVRPQIIRNFREVAAARYDKPT